MKKLIMLVFLLLSLVSMILISLSVNELLDMLGIIGIADFDEIISMIKETPIEVLIPVLSIVLSELFDLYGIPLIIFLVSLNGLTSNK